MDKGEDYAPTQARRKGGAIFVWRTLPPAISREDHSSYCSGQSLSRAFAERSL